MGTRDLRVDAFISKSADFAKPILVHLRDLVHAACPECEETIKWSFPFFCYRGRMLCYMSAFRKHAAFGFYRSSLVMGKDGQNREAMGNFGRLTSVRDLPPKKKLAAYVRKAMRLTDAGPAEPARHREAPRRATTQVSGKPLRNIR